MYVTLKIVIIKVKLFYDLTNFTDYTLSYHSECMLDMAQGTNSMMISWPEAGIDSII